MGEVRTMQKQIRNDMDKLDEQLWRTDSSLGQRIDDLAVHAELALSAKRPALTPRSPSHSAGLDAVETKMRQATPRQSLASLSQAGRLLSNEAVLEFAKVAQTYMHE